MRSNKLLRKAITDKESVWLIRREGEERREQTPSLIVMTASNFISLIYNTEFYQVELGKSKYALHEHYIRIVVIPTFAHFILSKFYQPRKNSLATNNDITFKMIDVFI